MFGEIRTMTDENGEPRFVGKEVAEALGYAKPENAIAMHVDTEDKTTTLIQGTGSSYTYSYRHTDGTDGCHIYTRWTQRGRLFLYEKLKKIGILPSDHVDEEDKGVNESFTPGGTQKIIFINEKLKKIGILPIIRQ